jgi:tetratricopeptide (TPR) repeat protein
MSVEIEQLVQSRFPGVELVSEVQGWAFLEQFEQGVEAYSRIIAPSPQDDRWVGVCLFQLVRDLEALEALYRALNRGDDAARVNIAHVLRFVERGDDATEELGKVVPERLSSYDQVLYFRVLSIQQENNGNLRGALKAAEEAWRRIQGLPEFALLAPSILAQLATLHGRIGRSQRALWFLERGLQLTSGAELLKLLLRRANVLISLGRYQEAHSELESLDLSHAPDVFQGERHWLLGEVARSSGNLTTAAHEYEQAVLLSVQLQMGYEEFLARLLLMAILGKRGDFAAATEHAARAQTLISDRSDRLEFRFREVLILFWQGSYTREHAIAELDALIEEFGKMGLLKEQGHVQLYKADILRQSGKPFETELDRLQALSVTLQNPAFLAPEWTLLPELHEIARRTHSRIAGKSQSVLRVSTLEQERLELNSRAIGIPLRRGVEVLAFFLENKAVTLKQLLAEVFPDDKPRSAKSYFHQFRHQLRENVEGLEIEYDNESKMYRLKSEIDIVWDVSELRAGRIMGKTGLFLPSSGNDWALAVDRSLDTYREAAGVLEIA